VKKNKVAISACLLGDLCRYDGQTKKDSAVLELFKDYEVVPFCPEAPILGTPRERISVHFSDQEFKVLGDESQKDFTEGIKAQVDLLMQDHEDLEMVVLKSKSPSCGLGTTPVLNKHREIIAFDHGIAVQRFKEMYPEIIIVDEIKIKEIVC